MKKPFTVESDSYSEDLQEIIARPPSWLLKHGIMFIFLTITILLGMSVFIKYPEMVNTSVKFNTKDAPKVVSAKIAGNLVKLLVKDGTWVSEGIPLAYIESTADHDQVIMLLNRLQQLRQNDEKTYNLEKMIAPKDLNLGELQGSYQSFYLAYLSYVSSGDQGFFQKRRKTIHKEVANVNRQYKKSSESFALQKQQLKLAEDEYEKYRLLAEKKVISPAELQEKEALLLAKRQTIPQMENNLISYEGNILSKNKELSDIENQISEEQKKFIQALNSFISDADKWKKQYVMVSPIDGKLIYGEFLQVNQSIELGQKLFYINPRNEQYYGELMLPQNASSKIKKGQKTLMKVHSYPYEEYGYLNGNISYISDIPIGDSVFFTKVELIRSKEDSLIHLKPGILGEAQIITEDKSILKRIWENLTKNMQFQ